MLDALVVSGSFPPDVCGVGAYTRCLMGAERARRWRLYKRSSWRIQDFWRIVREIERDEPRKIFMQYPTQGYGWSVVPHLLCAYFGLARRSRFIVVLHEYSQLTSKSRLALGIMLRTASAVIFTTDFERQIAVSKYPKLAGRSAVIGIRSNIVGCASIRSAADRNVDVVYFGHIRPKKGIERFLAVVDRLRSIRPGLRVALLGQVPAGFEEYFRQIADDCDRLAVERHVDLSDNEAAAFLNDCKVALLPFPDGVSERRGSALAALANGVIVVTTRGGFTTSDLAEAVVPATSTESSVEAVLRWIDAPIDDQRAQQVRGIQYVRSNIPTSWDTIADAYDRM